MTARANRTGNGESTGDNLTSTWRAWCRLVDVGKTSAIGFDDACQCEDFAKPRDKRRIAVSEAFERDLGLKAFKAWTDKKDRHPY